MPDTTNTQQPAVSSFPQPGVPFHDLTKWATKAPEGETLISTAYRDKVTEDLRFVENLGDFVPVSGGDQGQSHRGSQVRGEQAGRA